MSAFIVSDRHISALVNYGAQQRTTYFFNGLHHELKQSGEPQRSGQILLNENVRSVNHCYNETTVPDAFELSAINSQNLTPVAILSLCAGYDYQACETDDYDTTEAHAIIMAIRFKAIHQLPGYEEAPWTLD